MAEPVRRLSDVGIETFRSYMQHLREGGTDEVPRHLLKDPKATIPLERELWVTERSLSDRSAAARYLCEVLADLPAVDEDVGLWSWLSLYYFDQVCPQRPTGTRSPGRDYRHILEPGYPNGYRHLLAGAFLVYRLHGEGAPLLLHTRVHQESSFHHELTSRQAFFSNPAVLRAVHLLYWDEEKRGPKPHAQEPRRAPGNLRRFVDVVQQLDVNYDLYSMSPETLVRILPDEFLPWHAKRKKLLRGRARL